LPFQNKMTFYFVEGGRHRLKRLKNEKGSRLRANKSPGKINVADSPKRVGSCLSAENFAVKQSKRLNGRGRLFLARGSDACRPL